MFLLAIFRSLKFASQSFWRNFWLSVVTIFIIVLTFLSLNSLVVLNFLGQSAITAVKDKIDISVYFKEGIKDSAILELKNQIAALPKVKEVKFYSAEQNLETFKALHQDNPAILETLLNLQNNPLGGTLVIKAKNITDYPSILQALDKPEINQLLEDKNFDSHEKVINKINSITTNAQRVGIIVSAIFAIIVALIVFNTIRIAIFSHREEIGIMKLVGASNWFVRSPFIIESIFYALAGAIVSIAIIYGLLTLLQPQITNFFTGLNFNVIDYYNQNWLVIFGWEFLGIVILNFLACSLAVGKYLKV